MIQAAIPEMGLATALIALLTFSVTDTMGSAATAMRIATGLALLFTLAHINHPGLGQNHPGGRG